ncbi:hypothetical protein JCM18899A_39350 [Nocardioides sp. AN3]
MSSLIVYVDGFNLYHGLKDQFGRRMLWLDLVELARSDEVSQMRRRVDPLRGEGDGRQHRDVTRV